MNTKRRETLIFNIIIAILLLPFLLLSIIEEMFAHITGVRTSQRLANYTRQNKVEGILKSTKVEWRLVKISPIKYHIVCKEYPRDTSKKGRLLTISSKNKFNIPAITAIWSAIQMDFPNFNKFREYNKTFFEHDVFINYKKIIFESERGKVYPHIPNEAQNEYCRLIYNPKENVICCIQIWEHKPEKFFITGDKKILQGLIKEAPNYLLPFKNFAEILKDFQAVTEVEIQYTPRQKPVVKKDLTCQKQNKKKQKRQAKKDRAKKRRQAVEQAKIELAKNVNTEKIDINNADLEPIRKLPGINVVIAKRLINKREEINGFDTVQEVLDYINLNPRMTESLKEQICVKPIKINPATIKHDEINIDL